MIDNFDRWRAQKDTLPHNELAEIVLDESGYTEMWQKDKSADAAGRLENLKELVRSMEEFENLAGFLEHISLVMDADKAEGVDAVSIMTLHAAKGLEFDTVFLPGWEEGLFPHQRALDEQGRAGLEEERRLAHVGLTRARKRAKIYFATNRRTHGLWSTNIPSRFLDELPEANVEVTESKGSFGGAARLRRIALRQHDGVRLELLDAGLAARPGQQEPRRLLRDRRAALRRQGRRRRLARLRAAGLRRRRAARRHAGARRAKPPRERRAPLTIEGELVAKSTGTASDFAVGDRVFHQKFGNGNVTVVDGNKLTIAFDKAGEKRVVDSLSRGCERTSSRVHLLPCGISDSHFKQPALTQQTVKAPPPLFSQGAGCAGISIPLLDEGRCSLTNVRGAERRSAPSTSHSLPRSPKTS